MACAGATTLWHRPPTGVLSTLWHRFPTGVRSGALCALGAFAILVASLAQAADPVDPYPFEAARAQVIRSALARVAPSIVMIETIGGEQPLAQSGRGGPRAASFRVGQGPTTGLVVSSEGLIITSSFNFVRSPTIIMVTMADGRRFVARLLGRDYIRRLALLKVDASDLPTPKWIDRDEPRIGQYAITCGRGLGGSTASVSLGIISALKRRNGNAVQTDAKVSPVNYGGPLIDIEGRVIGVLVPMAGAGGELAGAQWYDSGIGFAIYKHKIDFVFDRLVAGETIERGKIGVILEPDEPSAIPLLEKLLPTVKGVRIKQIAKGSPASRAKLRAGDKILALDGQPTGDLPEILRRLSDRAAGEEITLSIKRRWRRFEVTIRLVRASEIGKTAEEE